MRRWCGVRRGIGLLRRRDDGFLLLRRDRPDVSITAAGQRLDPALPAGLLAQDPAQRRDLNRQVALLDCLAGPRGFDQRVLLPSSAPEAASDSAVEVTAAVAFTRRGTETKLVLTGFAFTPMTILALRGRADSP
jgi:hypothetical protein